MAAHFIKIQLQDGTIGYVPALAGRKDTLETAEVAEKEIEIDSVI